MAIDLRAKKYRSWEAPRGAAVGQAELRRRFFHEQRILEAKRSQIWTQVFNQVKATLISATQDLYDVEPARVRPISGDSKLQLDLGQPW